jgi:T1SS-143 domain-containing protein
LTVTVSGINPSWTIGNTDGTYNAATGTWTITMPAGQDYTGGLTFTPPANSDVDLNGINVKANSFAPTTNTNASITEVIQVIVDAVADAPIIDAGSNGSVVAGQAITLNITDTLTDTDGSESLGNVTISGLPVGYSLSAGSQVSPGVWSVPQGSLAGLQLNTPANGNGNVTLSVSVTSTESVTDNDFNLNNNTATSTDSVVIAVTPDNQPPSVTFGANGSGSAQVLEDGSVLVPITASLNGNAPQQLTVEVSGIPSSWSLSHLAGGSYNAATGTWTITMPAGQNFANSLRFTPPADSDVDLTGLTVTATSTNTTTNQTSSTSTAGAIIVDAVADAPILNASNASGEEGTAIALNISDALRDTDGSELLGNVTISGMPNGATLNHGTQVAPGVWSVPQGQLSGLQINVPNGATGTYNLTVSVTSTEQVTDTDFNLNNNTATTNTNLRLVVNADDVPVITQPGSPISYERDLTNTNVINGTIVADFGSDGPGAFCIPTGGNFTATEAMAGGNLSSGGVAINVTASGNTYTGQAGGQTIFTLTVNPNGSYTFEQFGPLDNASSTNPTEIVNLNFDICARDNDGDMSVTTLTVRVQDTGPVAKDDVVTLWSCDWATIGNVVTNHNQDTNGKDILSVEGPNELISVSYNGKTYEFKDGGDAMVVQADHGQLYMFKDGSYAYISGEGSPNASHREEFSYKITDGDGDVSSADLTLNVVKVTQTQNDASDYGNYTSGVNTTINGQAAYQTQDTDGAQVFGWTANDVIAGNSGNDAIYGWTGNDTLYGMGGNDVLAGEAGNNTLYGGSGSDVFVVQSDKAGNNNIFDTIMDFNLSQGDVLSLIDVISGFGVSDDITDFVRIVNVGGDAMVQVNTDGNGNDFRNVAKIANHTANSLDVQDLYDQGHIDVY